MNKGNDKETIKKLAKVKELFFLEVEKKGLCISLSEVS